MSKVESGLKFELYGSDGCHLCELAEQLVVQLNKQSAVKLVDIVDDDRLVELYGTTIPVIKNTQLGNEMNWPFDVGQLAAFLAE